MDVKKLLNFPKPYTLKISKKYPARAIMFEGGEVFLIPVSVGIEYAERIKTAMNAAYLEGYLQKEREIGEL